MHAAKPFCAVALPVHNMASEDSVLDAPRNTNVELLAKPSGGTARCTCPWHNPHCLLIVAALYHETLHPFSAVFTSRPPPASSRSSCVMLLPWPPWGSADGKGALPNSAS